MQGIERRVGNPSRSVFGPQHKEDAVQVRSKTGDIVGRHDRGGIDDDKIVLRGGLFEHDIERAAQEQLAGALCADAAQQDEDARECLSLDSAAGVAASRDCPITQFRNPPNLSWSKQLNAILEPVEIAV